jgi:hypothetical protein
MSLSFSVKYAQAIPEMGGMKIRMVTITFDNAYVNADGYTVTAADCKLKGILHCSPAVIGAFMVSPEISGTGLVLTCYKGRSGTNVKCADNEAGLNGLVGQFDVWGY